MRFVNPPASTLERHPRKAKERVRERGVVREALADDSSKEKHAKGWTFDGWQE